jgi:hypothetical protein
MIGYVEGGRTWTSIWHLGNRDPEVNLHRNLTKCGDYTTEYRVVVMSSRGKYVPVPFQYNGGSALTVLEYDRWIDENKTAEDVKFKRLNRKTSETQRKAPKVIIVVSANVRTLRARPYNIDVLVTILYISSSSYQVVILIGAFALSWCTLCDWL